MRFIKFFFVVAIMFAFMSCTKEDSVPRWELSPKQQLYYKAIFGKKYDRFISRLKVEDITLLKDKEIDAIIKFENYKPTVVEDTMIPFYYAKYAINIHKFRTMDAGMTYYANNAKFKWKMLNAFALTYKQLDDEMAIRQVAWECTEKYNPSYADYLKNNFDIQFLYHITLIEILVKMTGEDMGKVSDLYRRYILTEKKNTDEFLYNFLEKKVQ